jgi:hypothetical protein
MTKGAISGPWGNPSFVEGGVGLNLIQKGQMPRAIAIPRAVYVIVSESYENGRQLRERMEERRGTERSNSEERRKLGSDSSISNDSASANSGAVVKLGGTNDSSDEELPKSVCWFSMDNPTTSVFVPLFQGTKKVR